MINLTNEDKLKLKYNQNNYIRKVDLSIGTFYAKYCFDSEIFLELLGKKIADMVGIKCPNYYMFLDEHCVLSEDMNKDNNFMFSYELMKNVNTINDIRLNLEYQRDMYNKYTNVDEIMFQVYMMHFLDILFSNSDRHLSNYGFVLNDDNTGSLVVYDFNKMLDYLHIATQPLSFPNANSLDYALYSKEAECRYFMDNADDETLKMIQVILSKFNIRFVWMLMNSIEKENNYKFVCKKVFMKRYLKNYLMVYKVFLLSSKEMKKKIIKH